MVAIDWTSSVPPHIHPPIAQVPRPMREAISPDVPIAICSIIQSPGGNALIFADHTWAVQANGSAGRSDRSGFSSGGDDVAESIIDRGSRSLPAKARAIRIHAAGTGTSHQRRGTPNVSTRQMAARVS